VYPSLSRRESGRSWPNWVFWHVMPKDLAGKLSLHI